jgi:hypothetical protein
VTTRPIGVGDCVKPNAMGTEALEFVVYVVDGE